MHFWPYALIADMNRIKYNLKAFEMIEDLMVHELYMQEDIAEMANSIVENVQNKCDRETIVRISIKRNF